MRYLFFGAFTLLIVCCSAPGVEEETNEVFDWQGHRGARGLYPENSIVGFLGALTYPVQTLELDCVISKDSQVVVSHEPWFSHAICLQPNGQSINEDQEDRFLIWQIPYREIRLFDCGIIGNPNFPDQQAISTVKPLLSEVIQTVKDYCETNGRPLPFFNIEIKSRPDWDGTKTPAPEIFAALVYQEILPIKEKVCIQSFDPRALEAVKAVDPSVTTAFLVSNQIGLAQNLKKLSYTPVIYSPNHRLVNAALVDSVHALDMKIIPWTVNDTVRMQELIRFGVDGIITDYPNLINE